MPGTLTFFRYLLISMLLLSVLGQVPDSEAQDLEPRRWSHLPSNLSVLGLAGGWTNGDIFLDPVLLVEDLNYDLYLAGLAYVRSFEWLGKSTRFDLVVPYGTGRWEGIVDGEYRTLRLRGLADPKIRLSMNLVGAPPLQGKEFADYRRNNPVTTTLGAAVQVQLPIGEYTDERLLNLGANRIVVRPQLGLLHTRRQWQFELTGSVFLYSDNNEFWRQSKLERDPLWFLQGHAIYSFKPGWWASISGGFAHGGRSHVNGVAKIDDARSRYIAVSFGMPLRPGHSLKFTYLTSDSHINTGTNIDALLLGWSINWGR